MTHDAPLYSFSVFSAIFRPFRRTLFAPFTSRFILFTCFATGGLGLALNASTQPSPTPCQINGTPTLSAATGPGFDQITLTLTSPMGFSPYYYIYGSEDGGPYEVPFSYGVAEGTTATWTTTAWGSNLWLKTNKTYQFYAQSGACGSQVSSNTTSATTRDIDAPELSIAAQTNNTAKLTWTNVNGAQGYNVYRFYTTFNGTPINNWLPVANITPPVGQSTVSWNDGGWGSTNEINYYYVVVGRSGRARESNVVTLDFRANQNNGAAYCLGVHKPVNVSNGNMYAAQTDYDLKDPLGGLNLTRTYNSASQAVGLSGLGWSTNLDEFVYLQNNNNLQLQLGDGRAVYFGRTDASQPFQPATGDFHGQITKNVDNTFSLVYNDGRTQEFGTNGRMLSRRDQNGNQTTFAYNAGGQLIGVTDPFGRTLTITPNSDGTVSQISDSVSVIADYTYYSGTTKLQTVTYHDGSKYKFEYTTIGGKIYLTTIKDALDNILETHQYDSSGRATTSEVQGGVDKYTFDYTNANLATNPYTSVTDALGRVTKYYFDKSRGRNVLTKIDGTCSCGGGGGSQVTTFEYDSQLNLTKKTDALLNDTTYTYDTTGNRLTQTDVLGTQSFTYNSLGEVLTATDRMGGVTTNTYSTTGNLLTSKDALNNTTTLTYTLLGQVATVKDALNHTTTLTYDTQGRLTQVTDANGKNTNFGYDARARLTSTTNALSQTTSVEYDLNNRLNKVTYPDTNFTTFTYDLAGRRTGVIDPLNHTTSYGYDTAYRLTSVTDALSHATSFGYDLMSNMTSQTDALGNVTSLEYDDFNRRTKTKYPAATVGATRLEENLTYDQLGNVKTRIDTAGRTTSYDYDTANRLIKITDPLTHLTQFEYNTRSQRTKVTDALNQQYVFTYDPLGRTLSQTRNGSTMSFGYDAVGNRTSRTDYNGNSTSYAYDVLNRLTGITYAGSSDYATYGYDDLSRVVSAVNQNGTVAFTYDNRNRLKTETDVFGHVIERGYDATGKRNLLKLDGSNYATYAYDVADRLTGITNVADSTTVGYGYDNANRQTSRTYPNGVNTTYEYDGMSRLTRLKDVSSMATLFDRQYTYNAANQISQITEPSRSRTFGYDNIDRLTSATDTVSGAESYSFDAVGNRTTSHRSATYAYQPFNRLTSTPGLSYTYDANGNLLSKGDPNEPPPTWLDPSSTWHYEWDNENRLGGAQVGYQSSRYAYDALGRLVLNTNSSRSNLDTHAAFTYDGQDVLLDFDPGSGQVEGEGDLGGPEIVHGPTRKYLNGPGIDNKLRSETDGSISYFLSDHLGSTTGLTDLSGGVTESNSYDSFGNPSNTGLSSRYQFTGREFDSFSGLQFSRARWYDPNIGRFISEDPAGFIGGTNLYSYVGNRPTMFSDPSGLFPSVWPVDYHQNIVRSALQGLASPEQIEAIANANGDYDARTQDPIYAPFHAMRRPGQSVEEARDEADDFIKRKICQARTYSSQGMDGDAMKALGEATHTLQDSESPSHKGFQEAWPNTWFWTIGNLPHYIIETAFPGPGNLQRAENATKKAWDYYRGEAMPSTFFPNSNDHKNGCSCQ